MDKTWIKAPIQSKTYKDGAKAFIDFARKEGNIRCPCIKCCLQKWMDCDSVHCHILVHGFLPCYTTWIFHEEMITSSQYDTPYMRELESHSQSSSIQKAKKKMEYKASGKFHDESLIKSEALDCCMGEESEDSPHRARDFELGTTKSQVCGFRAELKQTRNEGLTSDHLNILENLQEEFAAYKASTDATIEAMQAELQLLRTAYLNRVDPNSQAHGQIHGLNSDHLSILENLQEEFSAYKASTDATIEAMQAELQSLRTAYLNRVDPNSQAHGQIHGGCASNSQQINQPIRLGKVSDSTRALSRWSPAEDQALISSMIELLDLGGWNANNGQFKSGAYSKLEALILQKLPETDKKARPHIESRVKLLRRQYDAITDMLNASGFGWNNEEKYVTCSVKVWNDWIKSHKHASGLRHKPFPYYDELSKIWAKDRAVGSEASKNADVVLEEMEEGARSEDGQELNELKSEEINSTTQCESMGPPLTPVTPQSTVPSSNRTKRARTENTEALNNFSTRLAKISEVMEVSSDQIKRLANCFQHESDSANRRMKVIEEIRKIESLSNTDVILAIKKIALNPLEVDFFYTLPPDLKHTYVQSLLRPEA